MRIAMGIISACLLAVMAIYLLDMRDDISVVNLHQHIPLGLFGLAWAIIGLAIVMPMYNALEKRRKDDKQGKDE